MDLATKSTLKRKTLGIMTFRGTFQRRLLEVRIHKGGLQKSLLEVRTHRDTLQSSLFPGRDLPHFFSSAMLSKEVGSQLSEVSVLTGDHDTA